MSDVISVLYTGTRRPDLELDEELELLHRPMLEPRALAIEADRVLDPLTASAIVVLYSQNAIRALDKLGVARPLANREDLQWWTVGPKTAERLEDVLGVEAHSPEKANFEGLRRALRDRTLPDRVVSLSLKGKTRDLSPALEGDSSETSWIDVPIYETVPAISEHFGDRLHRLAPDWVAFTSSRGVRIFQSSITPRFSGDTSELEAMQWAAIGPKTASTVEEHLGPVSALPDHPSIEGIFEAIEASEGLR